MNEQEQLRFNDVIIEFASLIQEFGAEEVAKVFRREFPDRATSFEDWLNNERLASRTAALFRK